MHTTQELWQASMHDPVLAAITKGVLPSDKSPIVDTYPTAMIANTDPHDQPGTHWIAMYFVSPQESEFFDSYGFPPENYGMDGYNSDKPMQGVTSDVWGDYCLFYLLHRARNVDLNAIQNKFLRYDSQWNDSQVAQFVHTYIQSLTKVRNEHVSQFEEQACKSFKYWRNQ